MRYAKIENNSTSNGAGIRVVLWCQGCSLRCPGCHNKSTWDIDGGHKFDKEAEELLFKYLSQLHIKGITFSGGHPLEKENIFEVSKIVTRIKCELPDKDIWLYTGWKYEDLYIRALIGQSAEDRELCKILNNIDVIVDGPFIQEERNIALAFRGSNNQRVIDVPNSLADRTVVLYDKY